MNPLFICMYYICKKIISKIGNFCKYVKKSSKIKCLSVIGSVFNWWFTEDRNYVLRIVQNLKFFKDPTLFWFYDFSSIYRWFQPFMFFRTNQCSSAVENLCPSYQNGASSSASSPNSLVKNGLLQLQYPYFIKTL